MNALVFLKSGRKFKIPDFLHINFVNDDGETITVSDKDLENFYLYDRLLTIVGKTRIASLHSADIEYIGFEKDNT